MFLQLAARARRGHTVLIIDPGFDNRTAAATMLASQGFEILESTDPGEGARIARRTGPCVIVTELFERTDCGWRILDSLRHYPETSGIPSSHSPPTPFCRQGSRAECGCDAFPHQAQRRPRSSTPLSKSYSRRASGRRQHDRPTGLRPAYGGRRESARTRYRAAAYRRPNRIEHR